MGVQLQMVVAGKIKRFGISIIPYCLLFKRLEIDLSMATPIFL
jgi:hypothetical protein